MNLIEHRRPIVGTRGRLGAWCTPQRLALIGLAVVGLTVRWLFVDYESGDYRAFLSRWYAFILANGHLAALRDEDFSNYNTPYLTLLALTSYLPVRALVAIKAISVVGDLALAGTASRIVAALRPDSRWLPVAGFAAAFFLPTVVMNGGVWAQCDSLYAAGCLACVFYLIKGRAAPACAWYGVALGLKLQAIFLLPILLVTLVVNRHRLRSLAATVVVFLAGLAPALLAGRGLVSLLLIYPLQITNPSGTNGADVRRTGVPGLSPALPSPPPGPPGAAPGAAQEGGGFTLTDGYRFTYNAPTPYSWLPANASELWKYAGLGLTAAVVLAAGAWLLWRRRPICGHRILLVAAASTLVIPLLLPEMHERYFYLAEVLLAVAAIVDVRYVVPAAGIQVASVSTYLSYFANREVVPLKAMAAAALVAGITAVTLTLRASQSCCAGSTTDSECAA